MARLLKPWFRKDRGTWFVTINGVHHNLGPEKKPAFDRFYELMSEPKLAAVSSQASTKRCNHHGNTSPSAFRGPHE